MSQYHIDINGPVSFLFSRRLVCLSHYFTLVHFPFSLNANLTAAPLLYSVPK